MTDLTTHHGGCHCGKITFEVDAPATITVHECNCSICIKSGYLHLIVPRVRFRLKSGEDDLITYTFNTGVAQHPFCRTCGIKSFYVPRTNPDGISVNVHCLDHSTVTILEVVPFNGQNWEAHGAELAHLSRV